MGPPALRLVAYVYSSWLSIARLKLTS